jgi:hypothetical protein
MDLIEEILSTLLAGLGLILMGIALAAASRYRDFRLGFVALALGLLAVIGLLSLLHQVSPLYGEEFGVDEVPLALAVVAVGLLYIALVRRPSESVAR